MVSVVRNDLGHVFNEGDEELHVRNGVNLCAEILLDRVHPL